MKIFCVGRNYAAHISELANEKPEEPVIFLKPETAMVKNNEPVYYPEFTKDLHHEVEIVFRVCKEGKYIQPDLADLYIDAVGIGIDFTARDLQSKLKAKGLPWEISKAFNQSAPVSVFYPKDEFSNLQDINFRLEVNGVVRQSGNTSSMLFSLKEILVFLSQFFTVKPGDLIFTGTPEGVASVKIGDQLSCFIEDKKLLDFQIK
jgi:2-keto-4-pentenoate hydratase/2-oxohepta-3-ene-1,7-dioic acid hydratase in catechol pathway